MSGLIEIVEELGGTVVLGGTLVQFSDDAFKRAFKEIYEAGAAAEREACAKVAEQIEREVFDAVGDPRVTQFKSNIAAAIRARGQK